MKSRNGKDEPICTVSIKPGTDLPALLLNQINMYRRRNGMPQMEIVPPDKAQEYLAQVEREAAESSDDATSRR